MTTTQDTDTWRRMWRMNLRLPPSVGDYIGDLAMRWTMPMQTLVRAAILRALDASPKALDFSPNAFTDLVAGQPMTWVRAMEFEEDLERRIKDVARRERIQPAVGTRVLVLRGLPLLTGPEPIP